MTELTNKVAELVTEATKFTKAQQESNKTLDAKVQVTADNATATTNERITTQAERQLAQTAKAEAIVERQSAQVARDSAEQHKNDAVAVVTGGEGSLVPTAGKLPIADANNVIDADWLPAEITGRNVFAEEQAKGNSKYAASGFVHMGKHLDGASYEPINDGLFSRNTVSNALRLGRNNSGGGNSKTSYAVLNIAGIETDIDAMQLDGINDSAEIKFPEAPNGTVTYDSATGVIMDYTKDVDPKYGDVAADVNEAVARAFEGDVPNGDFRFGDNGSWSNADVGVTVTSGNLELDSTTAPAGASSALGGINLDIENTVSFHHESISGLASIQVYVVGSPEGTKIIKPYSSDVGFISFLIPAGSHGGGTARLRFYKSSSHAGVSNITNISCMPTTTEVVTERVDMFGFEGFLEEVTTGNPFVYPNGLIQSQTTKMDGITTSASNRPNTYYAVFDGDTGSVGKGVNFHTASNSDKVKMFSNPKNNLYWLEGKLYQWRVRQRTIAGVGNGDWRETDSTSSYMSYQNATGGYIAPQGAKDFEVTYNGGANNYYKMYAGTVADYGVHNAQGLFNVRNHGVNTSCGVDFHCYFLVCGTVPRLNKGCYHPSINPMGTSRMLRADLRGWNQWYRPIADRPKTLANFFIDHSAGGLAGYDNSGNIGGAFGGGRPDGKFYDAIYASGQGGVIDYRLSAWDMSSPEQAAIVDAKVKNGSYRGVEKLVETVFVEATIAPYGDAAWTGSLALEGLHLSVKDRWIVWNLTKGSEMYISVKDFAGNQDGSYGHGAGKQLSESTLYFSAAGPHELGDVLRVMYTRETNISVSGEFTQTDVIGDPANILANPDLKDGWMGGWNPELPDGTSKFYTRTRKAVDASATYQETDNDGVSWASGSYSLDTVKNGYQSSFPVGRAFITHQTSFAKQTKLANNEPVFNGEAGLGNVAVSFSYNGFYLLGESLLGKAIVSSNDNASLMKIRHGIRDGGYMYTGNNPATSLAHPDVEIVYSAEGAVGFKAIDYQVESNNQLGLNYTYEELIRTNGTKGDDGKMDINDGQTTNTDDNGNTVLTGTNTLAIPYGWSKNNI
ncbi:MAG: hypothetical protein P8I94_11600 [Emcibacteraceae bacterium]|nr:hypothetical protein [Emcibacteraceae bacterium]